MPSMLTFRFLFEEEHGVLRAIVSGAWTMPDVERYREIADREYTVARAKTGTMRLLVDSRQAELFTQDLIRPMSAMGLSLARPEDRTAVLVETMLMKLQTKRMMPGGPAEVFISEKAAYQWLKAYDRGSDLQVACG